MRQKILAHLAQKWWKIFLYFLAVWLASPSLKLNLWKNHIFWWGVAWLVGKKFAQPIAWFYFLFSQSTWFSTNHVKCVLWLNKTWTDILSFCSILLTKLVKYTKKKSILKMSLNCSFSNQKLKTNVKK